MSKLLSHKKQISTVVSPLYNNSYFLYLCHFGCPDPLYGKWMSSLSHTWWNAEYGYYLVSLCNWPHAACGQTSWLCRTQERDRESQLGCLVEKNIDLVISSSPLRASTLSSQCSGLSDKEGGRAQKETAMAMMAPQQYSLCWAHGSNAAIAQGTD